MNQTKVQAAAKAMGLCKTSAERRAVVERLMALWSCSERTVYRLAIKGGWESGRQARRDKGERNLETEEIKKVVGFLAGSKRKSKSMIMDTETALGIAVDSGLVANSVSTATVNRYLRQDRLSKTDMTRDMDGGPHINLVSLYSNHCHQFDITNCTQYFFDDKGLGRRDMKNEFYLGKPENFAKIKRHLLRFVLIDHYSGAFYIQYFYTSGERSIDVAHFLIEAWGGRNRDLARYPFRGLPEIFYADKGSAANSEMVSNLLDSLGVDKKTHEAGNPRAKGMVEGFMRIWETKFESRLSVQAAQDLDQLNKAALDFCAFYNGSKILTRSDLGQTRSQLWSSIPRDKLRLLPPDEVCRELLHTRPEERLVKGNLCINYKGAEFRVSDPNLEGRKVSVTINPYRWTADEAGRRAVIVTWIDAWGDRCQLEALEVMRDPVSGFRIGERTAVIGEEWNRHPDSASRRGLKAAGIILETQPNPRRDHGSAEGAEDDQDLRVFGNHAEKIGELYHLSPPGEQIEISDGITPTAVSTTYALGLLREALQRPLEPHEVFVVENTPDITREMIEHLAEKFLTLEISGSQSEEDNNAS